MELIYQSEHGQSVVAARGGSMRNLLLTLLVTKEKEGDASVWGETDLVIEIPRACFW